MESVSAGAEIGRAEMIPSQEEYKADLLAVLACLKAHPHTVSGFLWFVVGFVLGKVL